MQTLSEIRELLSTAGLSPRKQFGQNFLIDGNLMQAMVELAEIGEEQAVLEVGPGTGSLTEELLARAARVVAVEIDHGLAGLLRERLADHGNLTLLEEDALAGKHAIAPAVMGALGSEACLVSNLPYNIATPLVAMCLIESWRACRGKGGCRFDRMTFTVQREVADRFASGPGTKDYGPVSVLLTLLGKMIPGPVVPAQAFWPQPKVSSRVLRVDLDRAATDGIADVDVLVSLVAQAFAHRRKQLRWLCRRGDLPFDAEVLGDALEAAGVALSERAERVSPEQYRVAANALVSRAQNAE
jgi:16S rRNA (adenine1518-N6/adenine1519-N6)-dimethyltransferase